MTGLILKKLQQSGETAACYKAAMSGNDRGPDGALCPGDAPRVKAISGIPQSVEEMCPYVYEQAVSPHLAARWEGRPVRAEAGPGTGLHRGGTENTIRGRRERR